MSKPNKNRERREMVEQMRKQAKAAERRRTMIVVIVCAVIAVAIVGVGGYAYLQDKKENDKLKQADLATVGDAASAASCTEVQEEDASGTGDHVTTPVIYETEPPAYGAHNPTPADLGVHFYDADDRPDVEVLVHNLEHGWTIVWYDETIADDADAMDVIKATAEKYDAHGDDPEYNVIFAPWTADDGQNGGVIPDDKHIAFTHWSVHQPEYDPQIYIDASAEGADPIPSFGESQYCSTFSGEALVDFTEAYPYDDAPEGSLWHR